MITQAEERLRLLNDVSSLLASSLDHQITLQEIAHLLVPAQADYCRIALVDEQQQIREVSVNHIDPQKTTLVQALYEQYKDLPNTTHGLPRLLHTGKAELIADVSGDVLEPQKESPQLLAILRALDLHSYMGVPLLAHGRTIGAIILSSTQPGRHYTEDDLLFAQEIAQRIAQALDNARLYKAAQEEIAERKQIEQHLRFLAEAGKLLASSLDYQVTLANVARLAVPHIADWCSIDMKTEKGIEQLAVAHVDPEKVQWAKELNRRNPPDPQGHYGLPYVLRMGRSVFYPDISEELLIAAARTEEEFQLAKKIGFTSSMVVPLLVQGNTIGAITFVSAESGRHFSVTDLSMAEELASRAALAIENSWLYTQAQNAVRLRDEFIATASHELKTPITSLKIYTQILKKRLLKMGEDDMVRSVMKMDAQVAKLTTLIADLLDVSRMELGKLTFQEEAFDLNEVIKEKVDHVQATTTRHQLSIEGMCERPVWGDAERIGQVMTNLLTNAVKYSPDANRVVVSIGSEQDEAVVSVQDFGIGMSQEHLPHIFDRFYRVNDPEERTYPGLGIGLHIVHEIVTRHGGVMSVASEKGKGSLFRFTLPYAPPRCESVVTALDKGNAAK